MKRALAPPRRIPNVYARDVPPAGTPLAAPGASPRVRQLEQALAAERDPARQGDLLRRLASAKAERPVAKSPATKPPVGAAAKAEVYRLQRELAGELNPTRQVVLRSRIALARSGSKEAPAAPPPAVKRAAVVPRAPAVASPRVRDLERKLASERNILKQPELRRQLEFAKAGGAK